MGARPRTRYACLLAGLLLALSATIAHAETSDTIEEGIASYYSDRFQGATTASGEPFDQQALTAAHPSLPSAPRYWSPVRIRARR